MESLCGVEGEEHDCGELVVLLLLRVRISGDAFCHRAVVHVVC